MTQAQQCWAFLFQILLKKRQLICFSCDLATKSVYIYSQLARSHRRKANH